MNRLKNTFQNIGKYTELRLEYAKYSVQQAVLLTLAAIISIVLFVIPFSLFIFFISLGAGYWIGVHFGGLHWGVLTVAMGYLVLGVCFFLLRKKTARYMVGFLADIFPTDENEDENSVNDKNKPTAKATEPKKEIPPLDARVAAVAELFLNPEDGAQTLEPKNANAVRRKT